jgi:hypothetical protein
MRIPVLRVKSLLLVAVLRQQHSPKD